MDFAASDAQLTELSVNLLAALDRAGSIVPFSKRDGPASALGSDSALAYRVAARIIALRQARGERLVGRKLGFTNRRIWPLYGVSGPLIGALYDSTVRQLHTDEAATEITLSLAHLVEPRLEPEIVLGLARAPRRADLLEVAESVDWVAHGFELVQSPYPNWQFSAADAIAAFGLHGRLLIGPRLPARHLGTPAQLADQLSRLELSLQRDEQTVAKGLGEQVLDGPMQALTYALTIVEANSSLPPLTAGDIITTGTLTDAQPLIPGQRWASRLRGVNLPGLRLRITS